MNEPLPLADGRTVLRVMGHAMGRRAWWIPVLVIVFAGGAAAGIVPPLALGGIVDALAAGVDDPAAVWTAGAAMAASVIVGALLSAVGIIVATRLLESVLARLREDMVSAAFRLPQARVERAGVGDLVSRAGDDVAEVAEATPGVLPALTGSLFTIVITFAGMTLIDPRYALALLVILPVHVYAVRRYLREAPPLYTRERTAMADRARDVLDALRGIDSVRAYGLSAHHLNRITVASWAVVRWQMRARTVLNAFFARLNLAEFIGMLALLVVGFVLVDAGEGSIGGTTAAMLLFLRLFGPINELLIVIDELQSALASLSRIVGVGVGAPVSSDAVTQSIGDGEAGSLRATHVSHSYTAGHRVLDDVDLVVDAGTTTALVGASGAGKSTLGALVAGILTPSDGHIEAPRRIVLVTQDVHLFEATLRENLSLARPNADDETLRAALAAVGADDLLTRLRDGLDEPLHTGALDAAQSQQIALARVVLADPVAVILDEATAEAGSTDADRLEQAALTVTRGRTALVIAHRLSQAERADRVVLLGGGRVRESGTHEGLLAAQGEYAALWGAWRENEA